MKITNYEIYKLKKSGLTNQQILKVLEYGENVDQELLLGDIADISGCRNPAVFMERYFQSEYGPGEQPLKFHFPARNRIIAGLCRGVIVAEAKMRSGSLITCERAMEEGRDVFAIPGSILDGLSDGCHHLIQEGAKLLTSGQDVLAEFEF